VHESGYILGAILLIGFGVLTNWTLQLLVKATHLINDTTALASTKFHKLADGEQTGTTPLWLSLAYYSNNDMEETSFNGDIAPEYPAKAQEALEYEEVAAEVLGRPGYIIVALCSILINVGAYVIYIYIFKISRFNVFTLGHQIYRIFSCDWRLDGPSYRGDWMARNFFSKTGGTRFNHRRSIRLPAYFATKLLISSVYLLCVHVWRICLCDLGCGPTLSRRPIQH